MIGRDSRQDMDLYGPVPWVFGLVLGGAIAFVMFYYALPIG